MARSKTRQRWLKEQFGGPCVKMAQKDGYRSRASYRLLEVQDEDRLVRPGMTVVDRGAVPGGSSQVASRVINVKGRLIAAAILPMDSIPDVAFSQGDITGDEALAQILEASGEQPADLVISDMPPNMRGVKVADRPRAMCLCDLTRDLATRVPRPGGDDRITIFRGEGFDACPKQAPELFDRALKRKPSSRAQYLLARGFRGA